MTLTETRQALADAVSGILGVTCAPYPPTGSAPRKAGDAWVTVTRVEPSGFRTSAVTLVVAVILSADEGTAERKLDAVAPSLVDAAGFAPCGDVAVEPVTVQTDQGAVVYGATLTLTTEV